MQERILRRSSDVTALLTLFAGAVLLMFYYFPVFVSQKIDTSSVKQWPGHAYVAAVPEYFHSRAMRVLFPVISDSSDSPSASRLQLFEQGVPLGPAHSMHADIEQKGQGRFSNWNSYIVFSATDNSNPVDNGRTYIVRYPIQPTWWLPLVLLAVGAVGLRLLFPAPERLSEGADTIDIILSKVSRFTCALCQASNSRYLFWATAAMFWLYLNMVFVLLLPTVNITPDSITYLLWLPIRTIGYPALLDLYHTFFGSWRYLPIFQLNLLLAGLLGLSYAIIKVTKSYVSGWLFLVLVSSASGAILLSSANMMTEAVFSGFVMLHLAFIYLFLNGSKAYTGLLAGLFLAAAILIKSVATVFLGPVLLFLIFLPSRRLVVFAFIFCPAVAAWLVPSVYNYEHSGFLESTIEGGYALGGYVAWGIRPRPGSAYPEEAKLIERRLAPILAKRPAHFKSVRDYLEYTANEYNNLLWGNTVPELVTYYANICSNAKRYESGDKCLFQINKTLFQLAKETIVSEPRQYAYQVLANYYGMWLDVFESMPGFLDGASKMAASQPAAYGNKTIYTQKLFGRLPTFESKSKRETTVSRIQSSTVRKAHDLLMLQGLLPVNKVAVIINKYTLLVIGIGIIASLLLFGLHWIPPNARAFCYTGLFVNAYFLGTALAQPALFRYAMTMQGIVLALLLIGALLVARTVYHQFVVKRKELIAGGEQVASGTTTEMIYDPQPGKPVPSGEDTYSSAIATAHRYTDWMVSPFKPYLRGNIVEIGIGHGSYYEVLAPYGVYWGIDVDERSIHAAKARFPGAQFARADILDPGFIEDILPERADSIVSINVLEHVQDDDTALKNLVHALKPGGMLMISVPAMTWLYNDLDRLAGHHRRYYLSDFRRMLSGLPVQIVKLCYLNPIGGIGWWVNCFRKHESLNSDAVNRQIVLFDKYIVPFSKMVDPLTRRFFGQSLICIAQRL